MKFFYKISCLSLTLAVIILTFSCIFQTVSLTQEKSNMQRYQDYITTLQKQQSDTFININNTLSIRELEEMAKEMKFVQSQSVIYVNDSSTAVVRR